MIDNWRTSRPVGHRKARRQLRIGTPLRAAILLLIVGAVGGVAFILTRPSNEFATRHHENARGRYAFDYPPGWKIEESGSATQVTNPRGDVIISFGLGARGGLRKSSSELIGALKQSYTQVRLQGTESQIIAGQPSLLVGGSGVNANGVRIRFLAITIGGAERSYAVTIFTSASSDPKKVLPPAQEVVASFQPIEG
jgi:hypothetical protein